MATVIFIFFRDTSNTCFDIVFFYRGSDLFDETNVSEIPDLPSPRKKLATSKTDRGTTMVQWLYADFI